MNIEKITKLFNELRIENQGKKFTQAELRALLQEARFPYAARTVFLTKVRAILNPERSLYLFPESPVHVSVIKKYCEMCTEAQNRSMNKRSDKMEIEEAIRVLKESGEYTIYKKVIKWEEVK